MRSTILSAATFTLAALLFLQTSPSADAYQLDSPRSGSSTVLFVQPRIPVYLPDHFERLTTAANKLNANPSNMRISLALDNDIIWDTDNGESELAIIDSAEILCGSVACSLSWVSAQNFTVESDVLFEMDLDWATTDLKSESIAYGGEGRPILNTALHEFSHALGLDHEALVFNVLGNEWNVVSTNGSETESVISEDTCNGLIAHYGQRPVVNQDLSLYHWKQIGSSNGYSVHGRTSVTDSWGNTLFPAPPSNPDLPEPAWYVTGGIPIKVEQVVENRGTSQVTTITWYLSEDAQIDGGDTVLDSTAFVKGRNGPYRFTRTLTLPENISGRYWVGAIIDSQHTLAEQNENNNAIYIAELLTFGS